MIIDYEDSLCVPDKCLEQHHNELGSLRYLAVGLDFLYRQTRQIEAVLVDELDKSSKSGKYSRHQYGYFIGIPELNRATQDLVACAFDWYSVTACNYARLAGWLAYGGDSEAAIQYVDRVMPHVKTWRDKVGAHFARTSPRKKDTEADLAVSVIPHLSFEDGTFYVGSLTLSVASERGMSSSAPMRRSLTETHMRLSSRYSWPTPTMDETESR